MAEMTMSGEYHSNAIFIGHVNGLLISDRSARLDDSRDACLACGVNYMDTANYEPENTDDPEWRAIYEKRCKEAGFSAYFDYSWQWAYAKKFEEAGLTALLGSGFDPGVTQAYCAYAKKHEFDTIDTIDILDCNGGDHGYAFATNFNPEINLDRKSVV